MALHTGKGQQGESWPNLLTVMAYPLPPPTPRHELHKCGPWILHVQTPPIPTVNSHPIVSSQGQGAAEATLRGITQGRDTCGHWVYFQGHLGKGFCGSRYLETSLKTEQLESQVCVNTWYNGLLALQGGVGRLRPYNAWSLRPGPPCSGLRDVLVRTFQDKVNYPRKRT